MGLQEHHEAKRAIDSIKIDTQDSPYSPYFSRVQKTLFAALASPLVLSIDHL